MSRDWGVMLIIKPLYWRFYAGRVNPCEFGIGFGPIIINVFRY